MHLKNVVERRPKRVAEIQVSQEPMFVCYFKHFVALELQSRARASGWTRDIAVDLVILNWAVVHSITHVIRMNTHLIEAITAVISGTY